MHSKLSNKNSKLKNNFTLECSKGKLEKDFSVITIGCVSHVRLSIDFSLSSLKYFQQHRPIYVDCLKREFNEESQRILSIVRSGISKN
jgi:hypothetical protein